MRKRFRVDAMDLEKRHLPILKKWVRWLEAEKSGGICVPVKARILKGEKKVGVEGHWFEEWVPSDNWDKDKE